MQEKHLFNLGRTAFLREDIKIESEVEEETCSVRYHILCNF
jgi:hypothetical protein